MTRAGALRTGLRAIQVGVAAGVLAVVGESVFTYALVSSDAGRVAMAVTTAGVTLLISAACGWLAGRIFDGDAALVLGSFVAVERGLPLAAEWTTGGLDGLAEALPLVAVMGVLVFTAAALGRSRGARVRETPEKQANPLQ